MLKLQTRWLLLLAIFTNHCVAQRDASPRVYRDQVAPNWLPDNTAFWYRNDLPQGRREFIFVDTVSRVRLPIFDHARVAEGLSQSLNREITADRLPIRSLEVSQNRFTITLQVDGRQFQVERASGQVTEVHSEAKSPFFLPPRPSVTRGDDVNFTVVNQLKTDLDLQWFDSAGAMRSYGRIKAGAKRTQHSFEGHVWVLTQSNGLKVAAFTASAAHPELTVDDEVLTELKDVRRKEPTNASKRSRRQSGRVSPSPDQSRRVFVRDHNLWIEVEDADGASESRQLTSDADAEASFQKDASRARLVNMQYTLADPAPDVADARWSPDLAYVLAFQTIRTKEPVVHYIESTPPNELQPQLRSYPYAKPGDPIPVSRPRLFRNDGLEIPISNELFQNPFDLRFLRWSADSSRFWMEYNERGHQRLRILQVSVSDGTVTPIVDEHSETFIQYSDGGKHVTEWLPDNQLLWASERTGWNHLYRYDLNSASLLNAVTSGEWNVRRIHRIDREKHQIWFYAVGIVAAQDPYHEHFCRVNFDGSELVVLTEGDGTHEITFSPDEACFLDRYSRVDLPPVTELRRSENGELIVLLEEADASEVIIHRGSLPTRFHAKGRDGETDIWGMIHRPRNFDPNMLYPVVENIYAGPHDHHVPKSFRSRYGHQQQIADRGMIVVQIDGMGTAWRSKAFHDVCFKNLKDAGFPDRIAWMKAAANTYPWMDLSRVGIYGGSAGGQNAVAALLWHGDFYRAAVADCGCHDNRMDKLWWNEQWMGLPGDGSYVASSNTENAAQLEGHLMLVVGELDRNVDPASTTQLVSKLIQAGKDFDFLLMPGSGHGACEHPYASRRRADFLAKHLSLQSDP